MKHIRLQGLQKCSTKKSKKKNKTKKATQFQVSPTETEGSSSTTLESISASQSEHEIMEVGSVTLSNEAETIDEISEFITNAQSDEETNNFTAELSYDNENIMLVDETEEPLSAGEKKKLKRQMALEVKVDRLEKNMNGFASDLKEIKNLLKIRSKTLKNKEGIAAYCKEACVFSLLPKFRLKLVAEVKKMETDVNEQTVYKEQLVRKMSSIGGRTVKEMVINIFKKMFTPKLKAKFSWTGFSKNNPKEAFEKFEGIISAIQIAVSAHYECTISDIEYECKLRLKQAQKDYDRQKMKKKLLKEKQRSALAAQDDE